MHFVLSGPTLRPSVPRRWSNCIRWAIRSAPLLHSSGPTHIRPVLPGAGQSGRVTRGSAPSGDRAMDFAMDLDKKSPPKGAKLVMGLSGVEPLTSRLSGVRSNHLSYRPRNDLRF